MSLESQASSDSIIDVISITETKPMSGDLVTCDRICQAPFEYLFHFTTLASQPGTVV